MVTSLTSFEYGLVLHARELESSLLQVVLLDAQIEGLLKLRAVVVLHNSGLLSLQLLKKSRSSEREQQKLVVH